MILVFGQNGQLAQSLQKLCRDQKRNNFTFLGSQEADFCEPKIVLEKLNQLNPEKVIIASAYTKVDFAETEKEKAIQINAKTPQAILNWCEQNKKPVLIFSTDYVFNGQGEKPWKISDQTQPLNVYGESKKQMEESFFKSNFATVVRTSWVFSPYGNNFVKTILRLAKEKPELKIVNDQVGAPTSALLLAQFCLKWIQNFHAGLYHLSNDGYVSWCEFAQEIVLQAQHLNRLEKAPQIYGIPSQDYPTPAKRPLNSRLDCSQVYSLWPELKVPYQIALQEVLTLL